MPRQSSHLSVVARASLVHFATLLRVRRRERGLTLGDLAERLEVSIPTVRKLLAGSPQVSIGTYFEAAHLLGVPLFDPDRQRFASTAAQTAKIDALLPKRVRKSGGDVDDDF